MKRVALFDFDGTITRGDSLLEFLRHMVGYKAAMQNAPGVLLRWIKLLLVFNLSHDTAKEALLQVHMRSRTRQEWDAAVKSFNASLKPGYFNNTIHQLIQEYQNNGVEVAVVSASIDIWLQPYADSIGAVLICTRSDWENDRWVGFVGPNCKGKEKVRRIHERFPPDQYDYVAAYGNSASDKPMLRLAQSGWMVNRSGTLHRWK